MCKKYNIEVREKDNVSRQAFKHFVDNIAQSTNKFEKQLSMIGMDKQLIWKIKYYILCLVSKGLYSATEVNLLVNLIKEN